MHVPYDTEKFYYGFPVYILAYPDEEVGSESQRDPRRIRLARWS